MIKKLSLQKKEKEYSEQFIPSYEECIGALKRAHERNLIFLVKWVRLFSFNKWNVKIKNQ